MYKLPSITIPPNLDMSKQPYTLHDQKAMERRKKKKKANKRKKNIMNKSTQRHHTFFF